MNHTCMFTAYFVQKYIPSLSQRFPLKPHGHLHKNEFPTSVQLPLFMQGEEEHGAT